MGKAEATLLVKIATKGKEALTSLSEKFDDLKTEFVDGAKKIGIGLAAMGASIVALGVKAAKFDSVKQSFESLAASQGKNAAEILKSMKELTSGMVSEMDLMVAANNATLLGLPLDKFPEMLKIAQSASEATGESMDYMLNSIVVGLGRQSKLILDNLGIIVNVEEAYDDYAETLNKTAAQLTDAEKKQAFINKAMEVGIDNANKLSNSGDNVNKQWNKTKATFENTSVVIGRSLTPVASKLLDAMLLLLEMANDMASSGFLSFVFGEAEKAGISLLGFFDRAVIGIKSLAANAVLVKAKIFGSDEDVKNAKAALAGLESEYQNSLEAQAQARQEIDKETTKLIADNTIAEYKKQNKNIIQEAGKTSESLKQVALDTEQQKQAEIGNVKQTAQDEQNQAEQQRARESEEIKAIESSMIQHEMVATMLKDRQDAENEALEKSIDREIEARQRIEEDHKEQIKITNEFMMATMSGGYQGLTEKALGMFVDTMIPGFGGAASQMFNLLSQDSEKFVETVTKLFSSDFIENIHKNIPVLLDELVATLPEFTEKLIESLIENAPAIAIGLIKAVGDPKFIEALILAIANGFVNGIRDGLKEVGNEIKNALTPSFGGGGGGGGNAIKKAGAKIGLKFAEGGLVPAMPIQKFANGGTVDSVPAMLTPGEFVVNQQAAAANLGTLQNINSGGGGGGGGGGNVININVNGGLMGDEQQAREFARVIDVELMKLRRDNGSVAFDTAIF